MKSILHPLKYTDDGIERTFLFLLLEGGILLLITALVYAYAASI